MSGATSPSYIVLLCNPVHNKHACSQTLDVNKTYRNIFNYGVHQYITTYVKDKFLN